MNAHDAKNNKSRYLINDLNLVELESLVEDLPDAFLRFNEDGRLTYANPAARRAFKLGQESRLENFIKEAETKEWTRLELTGQKGQVVTWLTVRQRKTEKKESELLIENQNLRQRQYELEALKSLSDRLINVYDVKEGARTLFSYLDEVLDYSAAVYLIMTAEEDSGYAQGSHRKESVGDGFVAAVKEELACRLAECGDPMMHELALKYYRSLNQARLNETVASRLFFPLKIGSSVLGGILLASRKKEKFTQGGGWLAEAMITTFLLFVVRWQTMGRAQKSRTESLVASLSDGVVMFNNKLRLVLVNAQAARDLDLDPERADLPALERAMPGLVLFEKIAETLIRASSMKIDRFSLGNRFYQIVFTPVKDNQGKVVGGAMILHDISRMVEIDQMKTDFVYIASHQLRTPLTGIKWFAKLLKKDLYKGKNKPSARQRECLQEIIVANDQVIKLVNELLSISSIESGRKFKIERRPVRFRTLAESAIKGLLEQIKYKNIKVQVLSSSDLVFISDEDKIRQVINNLVDNAVKYTPKNGRITISGEEQKDQWLFKIKDSGIGIPLSQQNRIGEKFFRADNASAEGQGTGLGLYLAKALVEAHGGRLWFESQEGRGTTFFFTIPKL